MLPTDLTHLTIRSASNRDRERVAELAALPPHSVERLCPSEVVDIVS